MRILDNHRYEPIGRCIYCGRRSDLEDEHTLPLGLGGTAVLPKASCRTCAVVTGAIEQEVLRGPLWPVRVFRDLRSRTKHRDAPKTLEFVTVKGGNEEVIQLPLERCPIVFQFPVFAAPGVIDPVGYESGIRVSGIATVGFGRKPEDILREFAASEIRINQAFRPGTFARMLAKIAYATAVGEGVIAKIADASPVISAILGDANDIGRWVGTIDQPIAAHPGLLHRVFLHEDHDKDMLIGEVHLFSDSQTPAYGIVLGALKQSVS